VLVGPEGEYQLATIEFGKDGNVLAWPKGKRGNALNGPFPDWWDPRTGRVCIGEPEDEAEDRAAERLGAWRIEVGGVAAAEREREPKRHRKGGA
jgi:hypothetical protein